MDLSDGTGVNPGAKVIAAVSSQLVEQVILFGGIPACLYVCVCAPVCVCACVCVPVCVCACVCV